jgi:hypothetical protein
MSMPDYIKIKSVLEKADNKIKELLDDTDTLNTDTLIRARRYNYNLDEKLNADSDHFRHGDRPELNVDEDAELLEKYGEDSTTTGAPKISLIGAVNPMHLEGASYIPAPIRKFPPHASERVEPDAEADIRPSN